MLDKLQSKKKLEIAFLVLFSLLIIVVFYLFISANGLILGNDPAVHLLKVQAFLETGQISLSNIGWIPPLFEIIITLTASLSGVTDVGQMIFLEKVIAVTVDWLLFLSVYIIGSRFFNKKIGALSAIFLSICYPIYFLNAWGGYTTALGMAFLLLLLYATISAPKHIRYIVVAFFAAFTVLLSHQLTAFIATIIMVPTMLLMMIKYRGAYLKPFIATIFGGALAFFAFYFPAIINYIDVAFYHMFLGNKAYAVDIPYTSFQSLLIDFGFIQFLTIGGIGISYFLLKRQKNSLLFIALLLSLLIPLFFAESHIFGLYLPFEWFIYYLAPSIVIFASVCTVFFWEKLSAFFMKSHKIQKKWLKMTLICLIVLICCSVIVFHVYYTYSELIVDCAYNDRADINTYDAAVWLKQNYNSGSTVVDTINPGDWFAVFSGMNVISQTYDWEGSNEIADSVLNLAYEVQSPQTLVKTYEPNDFTTQENYVSINQLWHRVTYSSIDEDIISFSQNDTNYSFALLDLNRTISFDNQRYPKEIELRYFNNHIVLIQKILVSNDSYPIDISWSISPLNGDILNVTLYLTTHFDLNFHFDKAQVPQLMNWVNPWDMPTKNTNGDQWATVNFSSPDAVNNYVGLYDEEKQTAFAFYFSDPPNWVSIGSAANRQIDIVRYQYDFKQISASQTISRQCQVLALSKNSYPLLQINNLSTLFNTKVDQFSLSTRNYKEFITENKIDFIVYDRTLFDIHASMPLDSSFLPQLSQCQFLKLIYSNSRYAVFQILDNYNQTQVWKWLQ